MDNDLKYWVWFSTLYKIKTNIKHMLLKTFGGVKELWEAKPHMLKDIPFMDAATYAQLFKEDLKVESERLFQEVMSREIRIITCQSELYPLRLKEIYDPPVVLYAKGRLIQDEIMIAVVGSRRADNYGRAVAEKISFKLASLGITVVSGMARGIDSYAHTGALNAGGRTVAVMGCGLDIIYPPENKKMFYEIEKEGALISEYPPEMNPLPPNFIARNRIISGISCGVLVVEAGRKSGSLITANYALEQGREVFSVPGCITSKYSCGTNALIKDGAKMVTDIEDILDELGLGRIDISCMKQMSKEFSDESKILSGLKPEEKKIVKVLKEGRRHIDQLESLTEIDMGELNTLLLMLEMKGVISQFPGRVYMLKGVFQ